MLYRQNTRVRSDRLCPATTIDHSAPSSSPCETGKHFYNRFILNSQDESLNSQPRVFLLAVFRPTTVYDDSHKWHESKAARAYCNAPILLKMVIDLRQQSSAWFYLLLLDYLFFNNSKKSHAPTRLLLPDVDSSAVSAVVIFTHCFGQVRAPHGAFHSLCQDPLPIGHETVIMLPATVHRRLVVARLVVLLEDKSWQQELLLLIQNAIIHLYNVNAPLSLEASFLVSVRRFSCANFKFMPCITSRFPRWLEEVLMVRPYSPGRIPSAGPALDSGHRRD